MNALAIVGLLFLMNFSKASLKKPNAFSESKLLQVKQVFLKNFSHYLKEKQNATNITVKKSVVGIKNAKQIFIYLNYSFVNLDQKINVHKNATVLMEPTANAGQWLVKQVINNTAEVQFQEGFIITL